MAFIHFWKLEGQVPLEHSRIKLLVVALWLFKHAVFCQTLKSLCKGVQILRLSIRKKGRIMDRNYSLSSAALPATRGY